MRAYCRHRATGLLFLLLFPGIGFGAELELRVLEGENATHVVGRHSYSGITVAVVNERQQPVPGAAVTFRLPAEGPSGRFAAGELTENATTDAKGQATVWGIRWGNTPGVCRIVVTAHKDSATAGISVLVRLVEPEAPRPAAATFEMPVERAETRMNRPDPAPDPPVTPPPPPAAPVAEIPRPSQRPTAVSPERETRRAGVIVTRTTEPVGDISTGRSKWLMLALGIAGAAGGGLAYYYLRPAGAAPAAPPAVTGPVLSLGQPAITVGKP